MISYIKFIFPLGIPRETIIHVTEDFTIRLLKNSTSELKI